MLVLNSTFMEGHTWRHANKTDYVAGMASVCTKGDYFTVRNQVDSVITSLTPRWLNPHHRRKKKTSLMFLLHTL